MLPFGPGRSQPRVTWATSHAQRDHLQTAFQITFRDVATNTTVYASGVVASPDTTHTLPPAAALRGGGRYHVTVAYRDATGCWSPPSRPALVHVSLLHSAADWAGVAWLGSNTTNRYRAEFALPDARTRPRAHVTLYLAGLGYSRVVVNGQPLGRLRMFSAAWTETRKQVRFAAVDVSKMVTDGLNAVAVELGHGRRDTKVLWVLHRVIALTPAQLCGTVGARTFS